MVVLLSDVLNGQNIGVTAKVTILIKDKFFGFRENDQNMFCELKRTVAL